MKPASPENKTTALISILIVVLIWGSAFAVTKIAVTEAPPFIAAFLRNLVASLVLLPFYLVRRSRKEDQGPLPIPWKKMVLMGLTGITFFYALFNLSLTYTAAATGALIQGLMPVAIALPAAFFLKEKLDGRMILGIIISVMGVVLIGFIGKNDESGKGLLGNILMILSVLSWAGYTIISKSVHQYDPVLITAFSTFIGTAFLLPAVVIEGWGHDLPVISLKGWLAIVYLGVFSSAIAYLLYNKALKTLSAAQAGNFLNLDPVIGAGIAVIFLKDTFTTWQIAGAVLVLVGLWLSSKTPDSAKGSGSTS